MEATCVALIAAYLSGIQPGQLDKTVVYQIPASALAQLSVTERVTARACASRIGVRYRIIKSPPSLATSD